MSNRSAVDGQMFHRNHGNAVVFVYCSNELSTRLLSMQVRMVEVVYS